MRFVFGGIEKMAKDNLYASVSHSKHRNKIGIVIVEMNDKIAYPRYVREWERKEIKSIPGHVKMIHNKIQWNNTFADQAVGQHLIRDIESASNITINTINTQKNLKDPEGIELVEVMDLIEMAQFLYSLKINHQIQFPEHPSSSMRELFDQISKFTEFKTESGTMNYFAPGEEFDHLTRALMICCFAARTELQDISSGGIIQYGGAKQRIEPDPFNDMFGDFGKNSQKANTRIEKLDRIRKERYNKHY